MQQSTLIRFYLGQGPDAAGRMIDEVLSFSYQEQEAVHDYIQWLFPLREPSAFNPHAPVLSQRDVEEFRGSEALRRQLLAALEKMLAFYGFEIRGGPIVRSPGWDERSTWLTPHNHNYLRITRILTSLGLLGLEDYARAFLAALAGVYAEYGSRIGPRTWEFWCRAAPKQPDT